MTEHIQITNPVSVNIIPRNYFVSIYIRDTEGKNHEYIASTNPFLIGGTGIWFGTTREYSKEIHGDTDSKRIHHHSRNLLHRITSILGR